MTCTDVANLIDPYMDGELDADGSAGVAAHVATCASCRLQLEQREGLRRLLQGVPYYDAPPRVHAAVHGATTAMYRRRRVQAWMAAAATVLIAIASVEGVRVRQERQATALTADAVIARHVEALAAPLIEVPSSDQHTVKPWFQGKLDFSPPVPDLASHGFTLVGGRVDRIDGQPVAALVYRRRLHVIQVFVWPARSNVRATDARTVRGFHEHHWTMGDLSMWAVSDVNDDDLKMFVDLFAASS
jgi:anti-sigma factor RsiW